MALTPQTAIAAGAMGSEVVTLQAFVTALHLAVTNGWQINTIAISFSPAAQSQPAMFTGLLSAGNTAAVCNDLVALSNSLIASDTAALALL